MLCLALAGCSDQVARVSVYPNGCRTWAFEPGITFSEEKTNGGFKCVIEYRRQQ
jgi:hypothetical protein